MTHARRYFEKALDNDKQRAEYFLTEVQKLYAIEGQAREGNLSLYTTDGGFNWITIPLKMLCNQLPWVAKTSCSLDPMKAVSRSLLILYKREILIQGADEAVIIPPVRSIDT